MPVSCRKKHPSRVMRSFRLLLSAGTFYGNSCIVSVELKDLEQVIPDRLNNKVCLHTTITWTLFATRENTEWDQNAPICTSVAQEVIPAPILKHLLERKFSDLTIECEGVIFPAHAVVLKCMSPVFENMLKTNMTEAKSGRIKVEDVGSGAIGRTLEFMYTGKLFTTEQKERITHEMVIELLHCADKYAIAEMKENVLIHMMSRLSPANAFKFAKAAELYGTEESFLMEILEFCRKNVLELPKGPELQEFIVKNVHNLF